MADRSHKTNPRLYLFYGIISLSFIILGFGLAYQQLVKHSEYKQQEAVQNTRRIILPGPRGDIYDRNGQLLVGNRPLLSAIIYVNEIRTEFRSEYFRLVREERRLQEEARKRGETFKRARSNELNIRARSNVVRKYSEEIEAITGREADLTPKEIERHFYQNLLLPLTLVADLSPEEYALLVEQLPVDSPIQILSGSARYYPYGNYAAHTLGFVVSTEDIEAEGLPGDDLLTFRFKGRVGRTGVERAFEDHLQGTSGGEIWVVDPSGFQHERIEYVPPVKGKDLSISIDADIQAVGEEALVGKTGAIVAMDVNTGEILAMISKPSYNLNDFSPYIPSRVYNDARERGALINRAAQGLYPPGSTFKLVCAIAGLHEGLITDDIIINCPGYYYVGKRRFHCHQRYGHGDQTLEEAIKNSCNVFFYSIGIELGIEPLAETARLFGLNDQTGIELPGETRSMHVGDPEWKRERFYERWYPGDTANVAIGHGYIRNTPLQMACFAASLARGETFTQPTIKRLPENTVVDHGGKLIPISETDYNRILGGMFLAASEGTARRVNIPGVEMAGKTGTADVISNGEELNIAWFLGFAPIERPEVAVVVMVEGTQVSDDYHGGSTSAPVAKAIFEEYFKRATPILSKTR